MSLWSASGTLAYVFPLMNPTSQVELALGAGAEATHISAIGVPVKAPVVGVPGSATYAALCAGATLTAPIYGPVFMHVEVVGIAPIEPPPFVISPLGTVFQPGALSARLAAGAEVHF
jgi:hypothetical protein